MEDAQLTVPPDDAAGGAVQSIAINPNDASNIFIGTVNGGVWRTTNADPNNPGAITWTPLTDNLPSLSVGSVAFDPLDATGNTLYAGFGQFSNGFAGGNPIGLYRTTNAGDSWIPVGGGTLPANRIKEVLPTTVDGDASPGVQQVILVAMVDGGGLFRSIDTGATFVQIVGGATGLPAGSVTQLIADPNDPNSFYVTIPGQGVFASTDGGGTWNPRNTNITGLAASDAVEITAHDAGATTVLYAGVADGVTLTGVFRSIDAGMNWTPLATPPTTGFDAGASFNEQFNMVADPTQDDVVYISGQRGGAIYRYDPSGMGSWVQIVGAGAQGNSAPHADARDLEFLGTNVLVESDDGGIYFLEDPLDAANNTWQSFVGNLGAFETYSVAFDTTDDVAFAGFQDNGSAVQSATGSLLWGQFLGGDGQAQVYDPVGDLRYSLANNFGTFRRGSDQLWLGVNAVDTLIANVTPGDGSTTPIVINSPGHGLSNSDAVQIRGVTGTAANGIQVITVIDANNFSLIDPNNANSGRFSSTAYGGGGTWRKVGLNLADAQFSSAGGPFNSGIPVELNSADPTRLMFGRTGVYESADMGDVIADITANLPGFSGRASAIAYGGRRAGVNQVNVAYVGSNSGQLYFRGELGAAFTNVSGAGVGQLPPGDAIQDISVDPQDWRRVFVLRGGEVWRSNNVTNLAANPFQNLTANLAGFAGALTTALSSITLFDVTPAVAGDSIPLVGALSGVYRLLGSVWSEFGALLPNALVQDVRYIGGVTDTLLAGTFGRGVWTMPATSTVINSQGILQIDGDTDFAGQDDVIRLVRDEADPSLLRVFLNGVEPLGSPFQLDLINQINVNGLGGNDTLIIDSSNGLINVGSGIRFDGGTGFDQVQLVQSGGDEQTSETLAVGATAGSGRSIVVGSSGTQTVDFHNLEPFLTNVPAADFTISSVPGLASLLQAANEIDYSPGVLLPTGGRVTVDAFEPIEFENKTNITIEAGAGRDNVVLDNAALPTGLQTIVVNGGASDDVLTALNLPDATATTFVSATLTGGTGADRLDASAIAVLTPFVLNGGAGADTLIGGPANDDYNADAGDDVLVESRGDDRMIGGDGIDTILIEGTSLADVITVEQADLLVLNVNFNGDADTNASRGVEIVRIETGDGDDLIGVSVADSLITPGSPDTDGGSLAFRVVGGAPNASDRLIVRDDGQGDLVVHRQGTDGRSGSVKVGPLQPVDYEGIEFVDITPLDPETGRTGDDGAGTPNGQLIVFHPDTKESNASRLVATPLGPVPVFVPNLSIDPGATELPPPFGNASGDEDWFEFRPSKTSTFRFDVLFEQVPTLPSGRQGLLGDGDLRISVYDATGTLIDASNDGDDDESLMIGMQAGQKYFLRVRGSLVELEQREPESAINVYDLNVVEVDVLGPQVHDPDGGGPLSGVHVTDDPATPENEAEFDLFAGKNSTDGSSPTPNIKSLTIEIRDPLTRDILERQLGYLYPALDAVASAQPGLLRLVGDNVGPIAIKSVIVTNNPVVAGEVATATIELQFFAVLPDDRYTLTVLDGVVDPPGNKLDGESNASEPQSPPSFPSGNGISGGNFVARFTVDSHPEIGVYLGTTVVVDINGNGTFDPSNPDPSNRDLVFEFGVINDQRLAGKLSPTLLPGYDVLIAFGRENAGAPFRFLIDLNGNGRVDAGETFAAPQINGAAVAGDFNPLHAGDELAIFDGTQWNFLNDGVGGAVTSVATSMRGYPIAGDFNGDDVEDVGTFQNNQFFLDYGPAFGGADTTINFGMPGTGDRPVAGDLDGDGIDDLGLWVPDAGAGQGTGEWRFLISSDPAGLNHAFSPVPLGHDRAFKFGDPRALPIFGNFDPPVSFASNPNAAKTTVTELYQEILGRDPDPSGLALYVAELEAGASADQVAHALATSPENFGQMVDEYYADFLNRAADAGGRAYWVDQLMGGMAEDSFAASLLNTPEYSTKHASNGAFVDALYLDILGRTADAGGRATHLAMLLSGQPRMRVIEGLIESPERAQRVGRTDNLPDNVVAMPAAAMGTSQAQAVVTALYQDILGRTPDAGGLALFSAQLAGGATRQSVAQSLLSSREYFGLVVDRAYAQYLHRTADAGGREFWIGQLAGGAAVDTVAAGLMQSTEYSQLHGSNQAFVTALYQDILGRAPDSAGLSHHLNLLTAGRSRADLVGSLLSSAERANLLVKDAYLQVLDRTADAGGLNSFVARVRSGELDGRGLLVALIASDEYLLKVLGGL